MPHVPLSVTERAEAHQAHWYAFRVRSNRERTVQRDLRTAGVPEFLPLYSVVSRWSDRTVTTERPLFPGYIFARCAGDIERVLRTRGVVGALGNNYNPTAIAADEITAIRRLVQLSKNIEPCAFTPGQRVRVETGAFSGLTGVVTRTKGARRLVCNVEMLGRAVSVELDAGAVVSA